MAGPRIEPFVDMVTVLADPQYDPRGMFSCCGSSSSFITRLFTQYAQVNAVSFIPKLI